MFLRHVFPVLLLLALGACAAPPRPHAPLPPPPPPPPQAQLLDPDAACLRDLRQANVTFEAVQEFGSPGSCGVANPVKVSAGTLAWNRPGVLSCTLARTLESFESEVVQPVAARVFGQPVVRLHHMGTYDCRNQRNGTQTAATGGSGGSRGGRLSEHAKGRAIDVGAFELADGTLVSVKTHWRNAGRKSEFLNEVARASCERFNVVLTPNHDRLHQDHLHLDIGPHRLCGY